MEARETFPASPARGRPLVAILLGGLLAGIGDIAYAIIVLAQRGRSAEWTLQSVASGLLGPAAFDGGAPAAALGLLAHFTIATGAAAVYYLASRRWSFLVARPLGSGLVFGALVFLFMNFVVLPLSAYPFEPSYPPLVLLKGFASHGFLVGLPIAFAIRRWGGSRNGSP